MKESTFDLDSEEKPPYLYATLIGISILSHQDKRLPLSQIYQWISDTFRYYKKEDVGWQNLIRHNLLLNKAFVKGEKSKDGKGHFWCIKPGYEEQFLKSRSVKKLSYYEVMDQITNNRMKMKEETKSNMNKMPSSPSTAVTPKDQSEEDDNFDATKSFAYTYNKSLQEPAAKRQKTAKMELGAPFTNTPKLDPDSAHPSIIVTESPNRPLLAGKNLNYTSSFSCKSNLELSPVRPSETGPLLEPLTPANNNIFLMGHQLSQNHINTHLYSILNLNMLHKHPNQGTALQQPPLASQSDKNMLRTPKSNVLRTPMRNLKTPQSSSMTKRLWNSPLYLDDFYYSPLVGSTLQNHVLTSYDDDDMVLRSFEHHPQQHQSPTSNKGKFLRSESTLTDKDDD